MPHMADLPVFDTSAASPARVWNYWLGGKGLTGYVGIGRKPVS